MEIATFAAGCFWGIEAAFRKVRGVMTTTVGYTGGLTEDPTYEEVCNGDTNHAEAVQIIFDSAKVSYEELLSIFWKIHDPTTLNRQGPDIGTQYRSAIFYHTDAQHQAAICAKDKLDVSGRYKKPIVTQIEPAAEFYRAEEYHQRYFEKRGVAAGCHTSY